METRRINNYFLGQSGTFHPLILIWHLTISFIADSHYHNAVFFKKKFH